MDRVGIGQVGQLTSPGVRQPERGYSTVKCDLAPPGSASPGLSGTTTLLRQATLDGFRDANDRTPAANDRHGVGPGDVAKVPHRVMAQEVGQQDQQLGAPGQARQLALVGTESQLVFSIGYCC